MRLWVLMIACGGASTSQETTPPAAAPAAPTASDAAAAPTPAAALPPEPVPLDEDAQAVVLEVFDAYERIREALAKDALEPVGGLAGALAAEAREAEAAVPAPGGATFAQLASAADTLARTSDLAAARKAFGEVSRALVRAGQATPALQSGWHIFRCPMAAGYQKWVQKPADMANPYMGTAMLDCGSSTDWS